MTYSIFDTGNLVVSFDQEDEAYDAMQRIVHDDPSSEDRLLLVAYDADGHAVADCVPGERIAQAA
jgi:hypothetical protein